MAGRIQSSRSAVDLRKEGQKVWKAFEEISAGIEGYSQLKESNCFYILDGGPDGANLYTYFPFLFAETFPEVSKPQLRKLSLMSLLYLYHLLLADALMDEEEVPSRQALLVSNAYLFKAFEILDSLLGSTPIPWRGLQRLHRKYARALIKEEQFHTGLLSEYRPSDFLDIISGKSAMAKLILLALCAMSGRQRLAAPLMKSFDLYYISDQLFDDFRDWKNDLRARRYSYLLTQLITRCKLAEKIEALDADKKVDLAGKHLYLSGIAENYLKEVLSFWEQAKLAVGPIKCPRWLSFLDSLKMGLHAVISEISREVRRLLLQYDRYEYCLTNNQNQNSVAHPVRAVAADVREAVNRSVGFLLNGHKRQVGFEDFIVFGETLPIWVSAYVGVSLLDWHNSAWADRQEGKRLLRVVSHLTTDLSSKRLGGWPTTEGAPADADTSAWVLRFLIASRPEDYRLVRQGVRGLEKFRQPDGGFCTYLRSAVDSGMGAYCVSHVEVTAVVVQALLEAGMGSGTETIVRAIDFIDRTRDAPLWEAYWWDGWAYATYYCLRARILAGRGLSPAEADGLVNMVIAQQSGEGCWGGNTTGKNEAFQTSLAIRTLMLINAKLTTSEPVRRGVIWLLNNQSVDGNWNSAPMMRVPRGDDIKPWITNDWKLDLTNGTGILIRDHNNFFTTATVMSALTDFLQRAGNHHLVIRPRITV